MTTRPSRAELRHSILAKLSAHTAEIEWATTGAHVAYADAVVDFADWLNTCTPPPPPLRGPGGSDDARAAAMQATADAVRQARETGKR